jgi:hypothetical protein
MGFNYIDLSGAGNLALIIIIFLVIGLMFIGILLKGVDSRFPKKKFQIFVGKSNSYRYGVRRIIDGKGIVDDDVVGLMLGKQSVAQPLAPFEHSIIYDNKGETVYVCRKFADGTLCPMIIETTDDKEIMRIEAYRGGVQIANEYVETQRQIKKTTDAVNPFFAVLLPALPMIAIAIIIFIGIYLIVGNLASAMVEQTKMLMEMSTSLDSVVKNIGTIQQGNPIDTGVVIHPAQNITIGGAIPSNLPINAR